MSLAAYLLLASVVASVVGLLRRGEPDGWWFVGVTVTVLLVLLLMFGDDVSALLHQHAAPAGHAGAEP
jgi:hypothetical protein